MNNISISSIENVILLDKMVDLGLNSGVSGSVRLVHDNGPADRTYIIEDESENDDDINVYGTDRWPIDILLIGLSVAYLLLRIVL